MRLVRSKLAVFMALLTAMLLAVTGGLAQDAWRHTGTGVRVKTVVVVDVNVYEISHYMKELPAAKSKRAVIDAETGKKIVLKMLRDVDKEKMITALRDAYALNGYTDRAKIDKAMSVVTAELTENTLVTIQYDAEKKTTSIRMGGGGSTSIEGVDFMKATWSIWFAKIDQPALGDKLISKIP
ncbi:MAG TPA: chalcone isomerase family protein [Polyangiaceae bacterium]|nr:chalcone isomerase family protein [Polyangiaceae bacterium]